MRKDENIKKVFGVLKRLAKKQKNKVTVEDMVVSCQKINIGADVVDYSLDILLRQGDIFQPKKNVLSVLEESDKYMNVEESNNNCEAIRTEIHFSFKGDLGTDKLKQFMKEIAVVMDEDFHSNLIGCNCTRVVFDVSKEFKDDE